MSRAYYTYTLRAGYSRQDHMADEIIARAARILGVGRDSHVAAAMGLASRSVGGCHDLRLPTGRGVAVRMRAAVRAAVREIWGEHSAAAPVIVVEEVRS